MTNEEMVAAYFARIGLHYSPEAPRDAALLQKLQYAHVTTIPYETLDIVDRKPLSMSPEQLFEKVVIRKRGGYCFELNGLFGWLLRSLGYDVKDYMARFLRGETEIPKRRHRVLVVTIDGERWICDVGVGSPAPRYPLLLSTERLQEQCGEVYKLSNRPFFGWVIEERTADGAWSDYFSFTEEEQLDKDFIAPSFYCENHPDSPFLHRIVSIKTGTGRIGLDGNLFRIWEKNQLLSSQMLPEADVPSVLREYFGL